MLKMCVKALSFIKISIELYNKKEYNNKYKFRHKI